MAASPKLLLNVADTVLNVSPGPCDAFGGNVINNSAAIAYVQFFDALAANVTLGTTIPIWVAKVEASVAAQIYMTEMGIHFTTACSIACTTTATGNTAGDCHVEVGLA